jgi:hypothetical protein
LPAELIRTVAGLALIGALAGALGTALSREDERFPAVLTLAVTASGLTLLGIGSAFWGLAAGLLAYGLDKGMRRRRTALGWAGLKLRGDLPGGDARLFSRTRKGAVSAGSGPSRSSGTATVMAVSKVPSAL